MKCTEIFNYSVVNKSGCTLLETLLLLPLLFFFNFKNYCHFYQRGQLLLKEI